MLQEPRLKFIISIYLATLLLPPPPPPPPPSSLISVIVPAYAETSSVLLAKIRASVARALDPRNLQIVVVDAGRNSPDLAALIAGDGAMRDCGEVKVVRFEDGGGRGESGGAAGSGCGEGGGEGGGEGANGGEDGSEEDGLPPSLPTSAVFSSSV